MGRSESPRQQDSQVPAGRITQPAIYSFATPHGYPTHGEAVSILCSFWRLLDSKVFSTQDAFDALLPEKRTKYFIRRLKEEMVDYQGQPIYKPRLCQTIAFRLGPQRSSGLGRRGNRLSEVEL